MERITDKNIRCDFCGCAFIPEVLQERDGDIEFSFFRCDYCGKAFMVSVTDSELRANVVEYIRLADRNKRMRLSEPGQFRMQRLKEANVARSRELRRMYLKEEPDGKQCD